MANSCYSSSFPVFQPAMRIISSITNGFPAIVTTTINHQYQSGLIVRLILPVGHGMPQANQQQGSIIVTGLTTFEMFIDTTLFDPFVIPSGSPKYTCAQVVPVGEDNDILTEATQNVLPY